MNNIQKWLLTISGCIALLAIAWYVLAYLPQQKKSEVRKQAGIECTKRKTKVLDEVPQIIGTDKGNYLLSDAWYDDCLTIVMKEWGYTESPTNSNYSNL